jgi:allophanate hydrolase
MKPRGCSTKALIAERYLVIRDLLASHRSDLSGDARHHRRRPAFRRRYLAALYRLRRCARWPIAPLNIDALKAPTAPTAYSTAQVLAKPIELNSRLGTYTNFVNLLDLCGLALPAAMRPDGIPFGITLLAPAGHDAQLASIGRAFHADTRLKMGARGLTQPPLAAPSSDLAGDEIAIAVVGAHLSGMALNGELRALDGRLLEATTTAPDYKLYALDTTPPKPGMLRVSAGTERRLPSNLAPSAVSFENCRRDPAAASIGTVRLDDGRGIKDFWLRPSMSVQRATSRSAAGARSWRRRWWLSASPALMGRGWGEGCLNEHNSRMSSPGLLVLASSRERRRILHRHRVDLVFPRTVRYARASSPRHRCGRRA